MYPFVLVSKSVDDLLNLGVNELKEEIEKVITTYLFQ